MCGDHSNHSPMTLKRSRTRATSERPLQTMRSRTYEHFTLLLFHFRAAPRPEFCSALSSISLLKPLSLPDAITEGDERIGTGTNSDWRLSSDSSRDSNDPAANLDELTLREFDLGPRDNTTHKMVFSLFIFCSIRVTQYRNLLTL